MSKLRKQKNSQLIKLSSKPAQQDLLSNRATVITRMAEGHSQRKGIINSTHGYNPHYMQDDSKLLYMFMSPI